MTTMAMIFVAETKPQPIKIMTKKDFEFIASLINAANNGVAPENLATLAAAYCAQQNPRFDTDRFLAACGTRPKPNVHPVEGDLGPTWWVRSAPEKA